MQERFRRNMVGAARRAAEKFHLKYRHTHLQAAIDFSGGGGVRMTGSVRHRPSVRLGRAAISSDCSPHIPDGFGLERRRGDEIHKPHDGRSHLL